MQGYATDSVCIVFHWDAQGKTVVCRLDVTGMHLCSES